MLLSLLATTNAWALAPDYEVFRLDLLLPTLIVFPPIDVGVGIGVEPKLMVTNDLAIGLHWESSQAFSDDDEPERYYVATAAYPKAELFVVQQEARPFIAAGAGFYHLRQGTIIGVTIGRPERVSTIGGSGQVGLEVGPLRMAGTMHALMPATLQGQRLWGYVTIDLGLRVGGGRIEE